MKIQVVVNARGEVIGTVYITPITAGKNEGIVGVAPMPDQTIYELELAEADIPKDPVALHRHCDQAIISGVAKKLG